MFPTHNDPQAVSHRLCAGTYCVDGILDIHIFSSPESIAAFSLTKPPDLSPKMYISTITASILLAVCVSATPAVRRAEVVCDSLLYNTPKCCSQDVPGSSEQSCEFREHLSLQF